MTHVPHRPAECPASPAPRRRRPSARAAALVLWVAVGCTAGCGARRGPAGSDPQATRSSDRIEIGRASWYGSEFAGRRTASGERYSPSAMTAAHRRLPFGSIVRVTNLQNGRSVLVRINDRGPHARGRILDCSAAAASALGFRNKGVARVALEWPDGAQGASTRRKP